MQFGDVFIPREVFGVVLRPPAVCYSPVLSEGAKTAWFVLALYAVSKDADYPTLSRLQHLFGVGRTRSRRLITELVEHGLIRIIPCAGTRKKRFVFLWSELYSKKRRPPKKPPARSELQQLASIVLELAN